MGKKYLGFITILVLVGLIIAISGCTSNSTSSEKKVIFEGDLGGADVITKYIPMNASSVTIEITNVTVYSDPNMPSIVPEIELRALNVEGQDGQAGANYINNIVDQKDFSKFQTGYSTNTTLKGNIKSVSVFSIYTTFHLKITSN